MKTRIAISNDIPSLKKLYDEFYAYNAEQHPNYYLPAIESGHYPQSVIDGDGGDIFVVEIKGAIVGFIHVEKDETPRFPSVTPHKFASIIDFYVKPQYRKRGMGKDLLESVKEWARQRSLDYIELLVLKENKIGQKFYERENFETSSQTMRYILK